MSLDNQTKINQLLMQGIPNELYFSDWLKMKGYSGIEEE